MDPLPTEQLVLQGSCCGCDCENCPYIPRWEKGTIDLNTSWLEFSSKNPTHTYTQFYNKNE